MVHAISSVGEVAYDVTSFLDKNRDTLYPDLAELMRKSQNSFVAGLFSEGERL